jgi:hypothetical protein
MINSVRISTILFLCTVVFSVLHIAYAHNSPLTPWFSYTYEIDKGTLPHGLTLVRDTTKNIKTYALKLQNPSQTPLYITLHAAGEYPGGEVPPGERPLYKLVEGKSYIYDGSHSFIVQQAESDAGERIPVTHILIDEGFLRTFGITITNFYDDKRPVGVKVPTSIPFVITGYFNNAPVSLRGVVKYSLNSDYLEHAATSTISSNRNEKATSTVLQTSSTTSVIQATTTPDAFSNSVVPASIPKKGFFQTIWEFFRKLRFW